MSNGLSFALREFDREQGTQGMLVYNTGLLNSKTSMTFGFSVHSLWLGSITRERREHADRRMRLNLQQQPMVQYNSTSESLTGQRMLVFQLESTQNALKRLGEYCNEFAGNMNPDSQNPGE